MSRPRNLEALLGFGWKARACYWPAQRDLNLLNTPAPPPVEEPEEVDARFAEAIRVEGIEPLH